MKNRIFQLMIMVMIIVVGAQAQDVQAIAERLDLQRYEFPQEKIHVMTDRGSYMGGDTIRLRAWERSVPTALLEPQCESQ